jgi:hypothetical protein
MRRCKLPLLGLEKQCPKRKIPRKIGVNLAERVRVTHPLKRASNVVVSRQGRVT